MDFKKEREGLISQRDNAFAIFQQAIGAITLLDAIIAEEERKSLTVNELEELVGAKLASIEKKEN